MNRIVYLLPGCNIISYNNLFGSRYLRRFGPDGCETTKCPRNVPPNVLMLERNAAPTEPCGKHTARENTQFCLHAAQNTHKSRLTKQCNTIVPNMQITMNHDMHFIAKIGTSLALRKHRPIPNDVASTVTKSTKHPQNTACHTTITNSNPFIETNILTRNMRWNQRMRPHQQQHTSWLWVLQRFPQLEPFCATSQW